MRPLVSACMVTRDRPELVRQAIEQFLEQDYPGPLEMIIVDNGTHKVRDLCLHPAIGYYQVDPGKLTLGELRNLAIGTLSRGDVTIEWDDDDWRAPGYVTALMDALEAHPEAHYAGMNNRIRTQDVNTGRCYLWRRGQIHDGSWAIRRKYWEPFRPITSGCKGPYALRGGKLDQFGIALDRPDLWIYRVTGHNLYAAIDKLTGLEELTPQLARLPVPDCEWSQGKWFTAPPPVPVAEKVVAPNPVKSILAPSSNARRQSCAEWPKVLCPEGGSFPPVEMPRDERILHLAMRNSVDTGSALTRAFRSVGEVRSVTVNQLAPLELQDEIRRMLVDWKPSLIFMEIWRGGTGITPEFVEEMREKSLPRCVIVEWDGERHHPPEEPSRRWFVDLGKVCDCSLMVNTADPHQYRRLGVQRPGFLACGVDEMAFRPSASRGDVPPIVCVANWYGTRYPGYKWRQDLFGRLARKFPDKFRLYGRGWEKSSLPHGEPLTNAEEAQVYSSAQCAISISIADSIPRYTSDRLYRGLSSGGVMLVEKFPDMGGLGLVHGKNCLIFSGVEHLENQIGAILANRVDTRLIRCGARQLVLEHHTWTARMPELAAIVAAVRDR